ncbi:hypothetical protein GCM10027026_12020 [Myroides odoratimimus subsp. xuanwuensis]
MTAACERPLHEGRPMLRVDGEPGSEERCGLPKNHERTGVPQRECLPASECLGPLEGEG